MGHIAISPLLEAVTSHPLVAMGALVLTWYLLSTALAYRRLAHIPGPRLAGLSNLWLIRTSGSGRMAAIFEATARAYGPVVRVAPDQVLTSDVDVLRRAGAVRGAYERHAPWYAGLRFAEVENTFTVPGRAAHDRRKARVAASYNISGREVDLLEPSVDAQVRAMVALLRRKYVDVEEDDVAVSVAAAGGGGGGGGAGARRRAPLLDFSLVSSYLTVDVITRAVFGREFGLLRADADATGWLDQLRGSLIVVAFVNEWPLARRILYSRWFFNLFGQRPTDKKGAGKVWGIVADVVRERFQGKSARDEQAPKDMLGSWINHGLNSKECESEGLLAIGAGSETTATVMRITLLSILSSPTVYQKLKAAIKDAVRRNVVSEPISYAEAKEIPYLRAVVMEGMRMRPGATAPFPKVVPPQGETVQGVFIPGGTILSNNIPAVLRDVDIFGPDAGLFLPERWLEADEHKFAEMQSAVELMFGSGRWMCAGKPIAYLELFKTFFELFRNFDFHIANPAKPWNSICYNVFVEDSQWVRVTEDKEI